MKNNNNNQYGLYFNQIFNTNGSKLASQITATFILCSLSLIQPAKADAISSFQEQNSQRKKVQTIYDKSLGEQRVFAALRSAVGGEALEDAVIGNISDEVLTNYSNKAVNIIIGSLQKAEVVSDDEANNLSDKLLVDVVEFMAAEISSGNIPKTITDLVDLAFTGVETMALHLSAEKIQDEHWGAASDAAIMGAGKVGRLKIKAVMSAKEAAVNPAVAKELAIDYALDVAETAYDVTKGAFRLAAISGEELGKLTYDHVNDNKNRDKTAKNLTTRFNTLLRELEVLGAKKKLTSSEKAKALSLLHMLSVTSDAIADISAIGIFKFSDTEPRKELGKYLVWLGNSSNKNSVVFTYAHKFGFVRYEKAEIVSTLPVSDANKEKIIQELRDIFEIIRNNELNSNISKNGVNEANDNLNDDFKNDEVASNQNTGSGTETGGGDENTDGGGTDTGGGGNEGGETNPPTDNRVAQVTFIRGQSGNASVGQNPSNLRILTEGRGSSTIERNATVVDNGASFTDDRYGDLVGLTWGTWDNGSLKQFDTNGERQLEDGNFNYWISGNLSRYIQDAQIPTGSARYAGELHGSAVYEGIAVGPVSRGTEYQVIGDFTSTVNFDSSSITNRVNNLVTSTNSSSRFFSIISPSSNLELTGAITNGQFTTSGTFNSGVYSNASISLNGDFYGANYDSVGGTFLIDHPGIRADGVFIGSRDIEDTTINYIDTLTTYAAPLSVYTDGNGTEEFSNDDLSQEDSIAFNTGNRSILPTSVSKFNGFTPEENSTRSTISSSEHLSWGRWNGRVANTNGVNYYVEADNDRGYWVSGRITPTANIPNQGSARYDGDLLGSAQINGGEFYDLTGNFTMNIDFAHGDVTSELSRVVYHTDEGAVSIIDANGATVSGSIQNGTSFFTASGEHNSSNLNHTFNGTRIFMRGALYGDNVDAVGGGFRLLNTYPDGTRVLDANGIFYSTSKTQN